MNAAEVLTALSSYDANVVIDGERVRLLFAETNPPPSELIEAARRHKEALRTILTGSTAIYGNALTALRSACPDLVEVERWQRAIRDADAFLATGGAQAHALGWTARELFGLHPMPTHPAPSYQRLSRYDATGLVWLLRGRPVIALSETEAAIQSAGAVVMYRKHRKPALGPVGDSLGDVEGISPSKSTRERLPNQHPDCIRSICASGDLS
jgi:hypothetical protein